MWFFFFKQKTAYEMRISDWSSDVCSSDLHAPSVPQPGVGIAGSRDDIAGDQRQEATEIAGPDLIGDRQRRIADVRRKHFGQQPGDGSVCESRQRAEHDQRAPDRGTDRRAERLLFEATATRLDTGRKTRGVLPRERPETR